MKKIFTVSFFVLIAYFGINLFLEREFKSVNGPVIVLGDESLNQNETIYFEFEGQGYEVIWQEVNAGSLELVPNFTDKLTANEAKQTYKCNFLVNGGFYSEKGEPIGLFLYDSKEYKKYSPNVLMNGILSINDFATPRITREVPRDQFQIGLQSGPILVENSFRLSLDLKTDKNARRVIAAVTGDNKLIFMIIYDPRSAFLGPKLVDLPKIIFELSTEHNLNIADAINLDGGSASAFMADDFSLTEISPVGSFFCLQ